MTQRYARKKTKEREKHDSVLIVRGAISIDVIAKLAKKERKGRNRKKGYKNRPNFDITITFYRHTLTYAHSSSYLQQIVYVDDQPFDN